jgi:hypothetical protein
MHACIFFFVHNVCVRITYKTHTHSNGRQRIIFQHTQSHTKSMLKNKQFLILASTSNGTIEEYVFFCFWGEGILVQQKPSDLCVCVCVCVCVFVCSFFSCIMMTSR